MAFRRRYDIATGDYIVDRTLTGPPPPPEVGTTLEATGVIVGDSATVSFAPATPVKVNIPGPREAVIDARGMMTPRWRRFFEELYRRTGATEDNINRLFGRNLGGTGTTGSMTLTGQSITVKEDHVITGMSPDSLTTSSEAPTIL